MFLGLTRQTPTLGGIPPPHPLPILPQYLMFMLHFFNLNIYSIAPTPTALQHAERACRTVDFLFGTYICRYIFACSIVLQQTSSIINFLVSSSFSL